MGRNYERELKDRVSFIKEQLYQSGAKGVIYGNSGGKDSALVGILCRKATEQVLGVMMPCQSKRNFGEDMEDGQAVARQFGIETVTVDLTAVKEIFVEAVSKVDCITDGASANIAPRLRMTTLYTLAHTKGYLVAGTGNRSEEYVGYFTKWGDGAYDFNPIADLTVTEIYEFLDYLEAPENIRRKAPSAGLYDGQTDEKEMGITYKDLDGYLLEGKGDPQTIEKIEAIHRKVTHKYFAPAVFYDTGKRPNQK
ncbi:NAD(+) synthase [Fumia xinanensis]|uniref:NH(3)-dependent NAD(+) synthetase n=1 Tax=Fumia xinanensis TaxID=2763659 RepID=A0A926I3G7_9FIRM|nr:NAD(+) synthase [Fumia xinanensis]MBC8560608.1 NAD(+) synthase [Fumia xinanensis]